MRLIEKYLEIEKAHEDICEQLHNKINFIHENVGKDYIEPITVGLIMVTQS